MMFTGTNQQQDTRFSDKEKKLMKQMKFGDCLNKRVDMTKVKLDVLRPWISKKITDILHIEDDVVVEFVYNQLEEEKFPCPKKMQINMTGFLNGRNARQFMGELWSLLLSAQESETGIPAEFIERKKEEILKREKSLNFQHEFLRENNDDNENLQNVKFVSVQESSANFLSSVENINSKLQGEKISLESYSKFNSNDEHESLKKKPTSENEKVTMKLRMQNIQNESSNLISSTFSPKKSSSPVVVDILSSKHSREISRGNDVRRSHKARSRSPRLGAKNLGSKLSPSGHEVNVKGRQVYQSDEKSRRKKRSSQSSTSNSSIDRSLNAQPSKLIHRSRSRSLRSSRGNFHQANKRHCHSSNSGSASLSPEPGNNDFKIRKNRKSIQTKRQYRKNRTSSGSSVERSFTRRNRRSINNSRPSSPRNSTKAVLCSIRPRKGEYSRRRSRSPRASSKSPYQRSRSPDRHQTRGRTSNRQRRNWLHNRISPQRQYSRDRESDHKISSNQNSGRNVTKRQRSPRENIKTNSRYSMDRERTKNRVRNVSPINEIYEHSAKQGSGKKILSNRSTQNITGRNSNPTGFNRSRELSIIKESVEDKKKGNSFQGDKTVQTTQSFDTTNACNVEQKILSVVFKAKSLSRTPSPFLKDEERHRDYSSEKLITSFIKEYKICSYQSYAKNNKGTSDKYSKPLETSLRKHLKDNSKLETRLDSVHDESEKRAEKIKTPSHFLCLDNTMIENRSSAKADTCKRTDNQPQKKSVSIQNPVNEDYKEPCFSLVKIKNVKNPSKKIRKENKNRDEWHSDFEYSSPTKKIKKHKSRKQKHKKVKKLKKRSRKFSISKTNEEDGDKIKNKKEVNTRKTELSESTVVLSKFDEDLEKKLRERALNSIKRSE